MFRLPTLFDEASGSETPPATGGSASAPASAGSDVNWVEESRPAHEEPSEATPAATPAAPTETPAAVPPVTPAAQPLVTPATPPQAQPPVTPAAAPAVTPPVAAPAQPAATPEASGEVTPPPVDRAVLRKNEIDRLTAAYAMNPEDAQQILTQPEVALPRLLANTHVAIMDALIPAIMHNMPAMVHQIMQAGNQHKEAEDAFYKAWPVLRDEKYEKSVVETIKLYRQINPKATREESIRAVGLNVLISHRLPIPPEMLSGAAPIPPAAPAPSFTPAAPGAQPAAAPVASQTQNPYTLLNQELDDQDGVTRR